MPISVPVPDTAELDRGPLAWIRTLGFWDIASWFAIPLLGDAVLRREDPTPIAVVVLVAALVWRISVIFEYVRCDADGVVWRTRLVKRRVTWERIAAIETTMVTFPRWGRMAMPFPAMVIVLPNGVQHVLKPSIWCSIMRHAEFIAAARLMSPVDWAEVEDGTFTVVRPGRGRRVGRPIPRRRRGGAA